MMSAEHIARLRTLPADKRERVVERACILHEACPGITWAEADQRAWELEANGGQRQIGGIE